MSAIRPDILIYSDANPHGGHHFEHLQYLLEYWLNKKQRESLIIAGDPGFLRYSRLSQLIAEGARCGVFFEPVDCFGRRNANRLSLVRHSLAAGQRLRALIERIRPGKCLLTYFDHFQLAFAVNLRFPFPIEFAGIYFRPSFHYGTFRSERHADLSERLKRMRQSTILRAAMRNPHLRGLFCLDPYSAPVIERINPRVRAVPLPDPVVVQSAPVPVPEGFAQSLTLEHGRIVMLLFGALDARKGTFRTLEACATLPAEIAQRLCIIFAGRVPESNAKLLAAEIDRTRQNSRVQLVLLDRFIEEDEARDLFEIADAILLPYQRFIGSSGVLLRAAAAGKPVIGTNFGLIGRLIEDHRLGLAIDSESPKALADAISRFIAVEPSTLFDPDSARQLARDNSPPAFAETIFDFLRGRPDRETVATL
jgi:glycosyltransferase involved in cell wall biosynthesis